MAVAECIRRIAAEPTRRSLRRYQPRQRREHVVQAKGARVGGEGDIVVARGQKVRHARPARRPLDKGRVAHVPRRPIVAVRHGIARLQDEAHRKRRGSQRLDLCHYRVDNDCVIWLQRLTVDRTARVAVGDEGEPRLAGRIAPRPEAERRAARWAGRRPGPAARPAAPIREGCRGPGQSRSPSTTASDVVVPLSRGNRTTPSACILTAAAASTHGQFEAKF